MPENEAPTGEKQTKKRKPNRELRPREYLTPQEVERLQKGAKATGRSEASRVRNELLVRMGFLHALRVGELAKLEWNQIDVDNRRIYINRLKNGINTTHPLLEDELRMLGRLKKITKEREINSKFIFLSEEGFSMTTEGIRKIIKQAGIKAGFDFPIHPHMLRHSTGHYLAENEKDTRTIQDYMGHRDIKCTVIYTQASGKRFENLFQ